MSDIILKNVNKSFGDNVVLDNFSACFPYKKTSTIMGASGKGKTTLLNLLLGIHKVDSGSITGLADKKVVAVFQEDRLLENLSALTNIYITTKKDKKQIIKALEEIGLGDFIYEECKNLSGGMKRRVSILRALLSDSDVLIFDEAFKGLDEKTKATVINLVKKYTEDKTLLLVTHIKQEIKDLESDFIITL